MDFFKNNLADTIRAINKLRKNNGNITVKKIRMINQISSSNHSKINFIWRSLKFLTDRQILKVISSKSPKSYKLIVSREIDIKDILPE